MNISLDAFRDPDRIVEEPLNKILQSVIPEAFIEYGGRSEKQKVILHLKSPIKNETKLRLRVIEYIDLVSILGNLVDNSIRHSGTDVPIVLSIRLQEKEDCKQIEFSVLDQGSGIPAHKIEEAKCSDYSEVYRLPGNEFALRGTGLRRVYSLAQQNNWPINYRYHNSIEGSISSFEILTPDYRSG
jgi:K+-sensing histidine kinase KdpD